MKIVTNTIEHQLKPYLDESYQEMVQRLVGDLGENQVGDAKSVLLVAGLGNDVIVISAQDETYRVWIGNSFPDIAPFRVTKEGEAFLDLATVKKLTVDSVSGSVRHATTTISTTGPTDNVDVNNIDILFVDSGSNNVTIGAFINGRNGQILHVVRTSTTNTAKLEHNEGTGNQNIFLNKEADHTLDRYGGWVLICDGSNWYERGYSADALLIE